MTSNPWKRTAGLAVLMTALSAGPATAQAEVIPTVFAHVVQELGLEPEARLSLPTDVAVTEAGRAYVVDSGNHQIVIYNENGQRAGAFGSQGSGDGQLQSPVGIALGPDGAIYVADRGNKRLQVFSASGEFKRTLALQADGEEVVPIDVAVSDDGTLLFVTANNSHKVLVFAPNGAYLRGWGGKGEEEGKFHYPATVVVGADRQVHVVDVLNHRVQRFDADGDFRGSLGQMGARPGSLFRPKGVALGDAGRVYVSDSYLSVVQVFSSDGQFLHVLGDKGTPLKFSTPAGLAVMGRRLYLVEMLSGMLVVMDLEEAP